MNQEDVPVPMFSHAIDPFYNMVDGKSPFKCEQTFDHAHTLKKENDIQTGQSPAMESHLEESSLKELAKCRFDETEENCQEKIDKLK